MTQTLAMTGADPDAIELTILMPCLDEAETVAACVKEAASFLERERVSGEVLVADNGSSDGSREIAAAAGARVVEVSRRGYGAAIQGGVEAARGRYVIVGDADMSYDFSDLSGMLDALRAGAQLVMGNRFAGGIAPGAMPALHRYLGNPVLSAAGRLLYRSDVRDFHCGLRGFDRRALLELGLRTPGMEYASEMVARAELAGYRIAQVPVRLRPDGRSRPPHLRSWSDGWRHLRFLFSCAPDWLFVYPGTALALIGAIASVVLACGDVRAGQVTFGIHTMLYALAAALVGVLAASFGYLARVHGAAVGAPAPAPPAVVARLTPGRVCLAGAALAACGIALSAWALVTWGGSAGFGDLVPERMVRVVAPAAALFTAGAQLALAGMFADVLERSVS